MPRLLGHNPALPKLPQKSTRQWMLALTGIDITRCPCFSKGKHDQRDKDTGAQEAIKGDVDFGAILRFSYLPIFAPISWGEYKKESIGPLDIGPNIS